MSCRSCGHPSLDQVLSLGTTPLANSLLRADSPSDAEARYPLELVFCPACSLVQITETVPPEKLFGEYLYFSSFSETMLRHAQELVSELIARRSLDGGALSIEIASNDGYLLQYYKAAGIAVLGIEPAQNVAKVAQERGIPTLVDFFGAEVGARLAQEGVRADVVHANNVLAHVADLGGFVDGLRSILKDEGVAVIEVPYVRDMIENGEFDTIYHEHLCYFSLHALARLFAPHGLVAIDVIRVPIHGGSLRVSVARAESKQQAASRVEELLEQERTLGMDTLAFYSGFARRVDEIRTELTALLARLKAQGARIVAYGAAAKGSTLLNTFGIGRETLDFVVDRSTIKQGRLMPGVRLPIEAPERLLAEQPDYTLLLTWNFAEEILRQQAVYRTRGGRFIVPIPTVRVI